MLRKTGLTLAAFVALLALVRCEVIFPKESQHQAAGGASGIDAGGTGAGGSGGFGAGGPGGTSNCLPSPEQKFCGNSCPAKTDPAHGCAQSSCSACAVPNAVANCASDGSCGIESCKAGFSDCNSDATDGCETNTGSDPTNCGSCGHKCAAPGDTTNWVCSQGTCKVSNCPTGKGDCNQNSADGCEASLTSDPNNCSFCGNKCSSTVQHATVTCSGGTCGYSTCDPGWADCDGNPANGCEQDIATDALHCGSCSQACTNSHGSAGCVAGQCTASCSPGYGNCDGNASNGCETNTQTDTNHCGSCSATCGNQNATSTCQSGTCSVVCKSGWANCDGKASNGCEANVTSTATCGSCTNDCTTSVIHATAICSGAVGSCSYTGSCDNGWGDCDSTKLNGCETDLTTDQNCGGCNIACTGAKHCVSGQCQ